MFKHVKHLAKSSVMGFASAHPIIACIVTLSGIAAIVDIAIGRPKTATNVPTTSGAPTVTPPAPTTAPTTAGAS